LPGGKKYIYIVLKRTSQGLFLYTPYTTHTPPHLNYFNY
jgi:hypothetical protein